MIVLSKLTVLATTAVTAASLALLAISSEQLTAVTAIALALLTTVNGVGIAVANNWRRKEKEERQVVAAKVENATATIVDIAAKVEQTGAKAETLIQQGSEIHLAVNSNYGKMEKRLEESDVKNREQAAMIAALLTKLGHAQIVEPPTNAQIIADALVPPKSAPATTAPATTAPATAIPVVVVDQKVPVPVVMQPEDKPRP